MSDKFDISNVQIADIVKNLITTVDNFRSESSVENNLVDVFAAAAEVATFGHKNENEWREPELHRQKQKALMNSIGMAHQEIIGQLDGFTSFKPSRQNPMPDVVGVRNNQKIFAEIKNKHNTMNARSSEATYHNMLRYSQKEEFKNFVGVVVQIIAPVPKSGDIMWQEFAPGRDTKPYKNIIKMSGRVFYALVTDEKKRQPGKDVKFDEDLTKWPSWNTIDLIAEKFLQELDIQTKKSTPKWIRELFQSNREVSF
jgi:hypothetical protein